MIDNTYDRFMVQSVEGRRRNIVDSDDKTFGDDNTLFGQINGALRFGISLHVTPTKKRRKKRDRKETQYLLQGEFNVFLPNERYYTQHPTSHSIIGIDMFLPFIPQVGYDKIYIFRIQN